MITFTQPPHAMSPSRTPAPSKHGHFTHPSLEDRFLRALATEQQRLALVAQQEQDQLKRLREAEELQRQQDTIRMRGSQDRHRRRSEYETRKCRPVFVAPFFASAMGREDLVEDESFKLRRRAHSVEGRRFESPFSPFVSRHQNLSPLSPSDADLKKAATTIQKYWRLHLARRESRAAISSCQSQFNNLRSSFNFPSQLDFAPSPSSCTPDALPGLLYTASNAPLIQCESNLTDLLTELDDISSPRSLEIENARKELISAIEAELETIDWSKARVWEAQRKLNNDLEVERQLDASEAGTDHSPASPTYPPRNLPLAKSTSQSPSFQSTEGKDMEKVGEALPPATGSTATNSSADEASYSDDDLDSLDSFAML